MLRSSLSVKRVKAVYHNPYSSLPTSLERGRVLMPGAGTEPTQLPSPRVSFAGREGIS